MISKKIVADFDPKFAARSRSDELIWPIINTKNVSKADKDGEENDENKMATAVIMASSRNIRKMLPQIDAAKPVPPT